MKHDRKRRRVPTAPVVLSALLLALPALPGCVTTNPATGERELTPFMSPAEERRIGAEEHPRMLARFGGVYDDIEIGAYVAEVGGRLVKSSELSDLEFTFTVLNSPEVNAFALPGGYVYVTRGLLALANSEAELASVLAHEIGHVTARHSARRYNRAIAANLGAAVLGAATRNSTVEQLGQIGGELFLKGFSREQEFQADVLGVRYMSRVGYDPEASATFLRALADHDALERELAGREGRGAFENLFSTHPRTQDRVRKAIAAARESGARADAPRRRDRFLETVEGLLYGDDPEQGLVRGRAFVHPRLGFAFTAPPGYRLFNTQDAVFAKGPGNALIRFDAAKERMAGDVASYLTRTWARELALSDVERIRINGMEAATGRATIRSRDGFAELRLVAIRFSPDAIYRFTMVTPPAVEPGLRRELQRATYSFRRLERGEAAAYRPFRLEVVTVEPGDTVASLARRMPFEDFRTARLLALNGLRRGVRLSPGQRIKIVVE